MYPFPVSGGGVEAGGQTSPGSKSGLSRGSEREREKGKELEKAVSGKEKGKGLYTEKNVPQLRSARARDGGRTKSGGVRGLLRADSDRDDF